MRGERRRVFFPFETIDVSSSSSSLLSFIHALSHLLTQSPTLTTKTNTHQLCDEHGIGPDGQLLDPEVVSFFSSSSASFVVVVVVVVVDALHASLSLALSLAPPPSVRTFSLSLLVLSSHTHLQHLHTASRISQIPSGSLRKLPEGPRSRSPGACEGHTCRVHAWDQQCLHLHSIFSEDAMKLFARKSAMKIFPSGKRADKSIFVNT